MTTNTQTCDYLFGFAAFYKIGFHFTIKADNFISLDVASYST